MPAIFPVYIFKGDEKYLKKEAVEKLKKALLKKGSEAFDFNIYDIGRCATVEVLDTLRSAPLMSSKRLIVVRDMGLLSEKDAGSLVEYAKKPSKNSCLVIDLSRDELQGDFYANIRPYAKEVAFMPLKGEKLISWIREEFKKRGRPVHYEAAAILAEIKEDGSDGLINEIEKLVSHAGKRPMGTKSDVEKLTGGPVMRNVFDLVDALGVKDCKRSLVISNELVKTKKAVPEMLGLVGWQLRKLKRVKDTKHFTKKEIDKLLDHLLEADRGIKTGHLKGQDALEMLIIKICASDL